MMNLMRLRLFRELADRGTMTAVGLAFGMTSSAVSQQLAILEREARVALLERVGRRVRLTEEGRRLAAHADAILQAVADAEQDLSPVDTAPKGVLEIACFPTFAKLRLLPAVERLRARSPELKIVIQERESLDAIEAVRKGRCHVAVRFAYNLVPQPDIAGLVSYPLLEEPVFLALPESPRWQAGPQAEPIPLAQVAEADWIVGSRQSDDRRLAERACALAGYVPRMTHQADDYDLVLGMVAAGLGIGFVPESALQLPGARGVIARVPGGAPLRRRIEAVTRRALASSPMVRALLAELPPPSKRGMH
jgi:DNA-binding transcriptional LysR family regulator